MEAGVLHVRHRVRVAARGAAVRRASAASRRRRRAGGLALAAAVVLLIELFSRDGFAVLRVYQMLFPLVAGACFMPPYVAGRAVRALLASGMPPFGFEIVNLLLIVTCAVYASERSRRRCRCTRCAWALRWRPCSQAMCWAGT
ncbi:MAG: hypothetical protein V8S24_16740 [Gordonibacter pamelaeae]